MEIDVFTLFPGAFEWFESQRHVRNAVAAGHRLGYVNYRDHTPLTGGQVDDTPFGGGAGMVLRVDVVEAALRARYEIDPVALPERRRVIALTPSGRLLDDELVEQLAAEPALTVLCGRYEGFDERIVEHFASDRLSIGRYVLAGGELAAMVVCDAVLRKLPGSLGHEESVLEESFSRALEGAPEYPHYTRPADWRGWPVPEVLLSGHHANIRDWRLEQAHARAPTRVRYHRPPRATARPVRIPFLGARPAPVLPHEQAPLPYGAPSSKTWSAPSSAGSRTSTQATACVSISRSSRAPAAERRSSRES